MGSLANNLIHKGYLKTDVIIDAFSEIERTEFVPDRFRVAASSDIPISIGHGQLLPEPSVLSFMLELLRPGRDQEVLVVGFGSGWVVALLSYIVGAGGHVTAIDTIAPLRDEAQENISKYNFIARDNISDLQLVQSAENIDGEKKYERIIVVNPGLWDMYDYAQLLQEDGVMVAPIDNIIYYFNNRGDDEEMVEERFDSIRFLPV